MAEKMTKLDEHALTGNREAYRKTFLQQVRTTRTMSRNALNTFSGFLPYANHEQAISLAHECEALEARIEFCNAVERDIDAHVAAVFS